MKSETRSRDHDSSLRLVSLVEAKGGGWVGWGAVDGEGYKLFVPVNARYILPESHSPAAQQPGAFQRVGSEHFKSLSNQTTYLGSLK